MRWRHSVNSLLTFLGGCSECWRTKRLSICTLKASSVLLLKEEKPMFALRRKFWVTRAFCTPVCLITWISGADFSNIPVLQIPALQIPANLVWFPPCSANSPFNTFSTNVQDLHPLSWILASTLKGMYVPHNPLLFRTCWSKCSLWWPEGILWAFCLFLLPKRPDSHQE